METKEFTNVAEICRRRQYARKTQTQEVELAPLEGEWLTRTLFLLARIRNLSFPVYGDRFILNRTLEGFEILQRSGRLKRRVVYRQLAGGLLKAASYFVRLEMSSR